MSSGTRELSASQPFRLKVCLIGLVDFRLSTISSKQQIAITLKTGHYPNSKYVYRRFMHLCGAIGASTDLIQNEQLTRRSTLTSKDALSSLIGSEVRRTNQLSLHISKLHTSEIANICKLTDKVVNSMCTLAEPGIDFQGRSMLSPSRCYSLQPCR